MFKPYDYYITPDEYEAAATNNIKRITLMIAFDVLVGQKIKLLQNLCEYTQTDQRLGKLLDQTEYPMN
ncbi:hypothetical protein BBD42_26950 [Paenibacillus sp. BIHB 4019]|uniref:Uncharacterized protein n=1 Tax=Paenibacillus sp. BIHB 4019 TaxID=1870819 RepID=A0A1B2DPU1_9BACL|nr:hypothetical protein BBD42_26950 [Paenibacillus sp. BIHB 4019]